MPPIPPISPRSPGSPGSSQAPYRRPDGGAGASAAAPAAAKPAPVLAEVIDHLSADIQRLRIDFERFFSGALLLPPEDLRQRVQAQLRVLRNVNGGTAVDRFRLGDLEARFNTYNELFNRRLRDREEGRRRAAEESLHPATPSPARYDPASGIVIGRAAAPEAVQALYEGLAAGGERGQGPRFDLATFGAYLERQAAAIREKSGCEEVHFRLATEDGKLKLKARPLSGART
jgi:hypothetical protein